MAPMGMLLPSGLVRLIWSYVLHNLVLHAQFIDRLNTVGGGVVVTDLIQTIIQISFQQQVVPSFEG